MKTVLFASLLIVSAIGPAHADSDDRPGRDWMPLSTVAQKLQGLGFNDLTKIEADDGVWKAKGYKNGQYFKVKLDPRTGQVIEERPEYKHHADRDD